MTLDRNGTYLIRHRQDVGAAAVEILYRKILRQCRVSVDGVFARRLPIAGTPVCQEGAGAPIDDDKRRDIQVAGKGMGIQYSQYKCRKL
jgi:hypothetical protein